MRLPRLSPTALALVPASLLLRPVSAGPTPGTRDLPTTTTILLSVPAQDGYLKESHWTSGVGGSALSTGSSFNVGDTTSREQLVGLLSFDTSAIPANATITAAQLVLTRNGATGNPGALGSLVADTRCGGVFGAAPLEPTDFETYAQFQEVATFPLPTRNGQATSAPLSPDGRNVLPRGPGATSQFKIRFTSPDNANAIADYLILGTADGATGSQPRLVVTWTTP